MEDMAEYEAGRELNKLIAEKVMGWGGFWTDGILLYGMHPDHQGNIENDRIEVPYYSTDIAAAWEVLMAVSNESSWYELAWRPSGALANLTGDPHHNAYATFDECGNSRSKAQALAICRAAIKAKEWMTETTMEQGS